MQTKNNGEKNMNMSKINELNFKKIKKKRCKIYSLTKVVLLKCEKSN